MPIKLITTTEVGEGREIKKRKKIQKNLQNTSKHKNNECFSQITAVTVRLTSLGCLQFWAGLLPVVAAAQTLIWSYSCMFLLSCLYLPVLVCFLLQELSLSFIYSIDKKSARWSCRFNLQLVPLVGMFWFYSLDTCPWISLVVLSPPSHVCRP